MIEGQGRPSPQYLAEVEKKRQAVERLRAEVELKEGLPHLYGWKWYIWAREFFESKNRLNFLCAANQVSKSSTQIRKCIHWATATELWPDLWVNEPSQFWYMYPTSPQATIEFEKKWKKNFLPRGKYQTEREIDGKPNPYCWKAEIKNKEIHAIHFLVTGVSIYFKTYAQDEEALQTGTVDALFLDEELPVDRWSELSFRVTATDGYIHMVFTATLGQEMWRETMEPEEHEVELFPHALKIHASLYDSQKYEDGTPSQWTDERIERVKANCKDANEILRRVYGRFVRDATGRKYPAFDIKRHVKPKHPVPAGWLTYGGVDIGSGGTNHPAAVCFVAVRPDFKAGRVFLGWRGDGVVTTAGDTLKKFIELRDRGIPGYPLRPAMSCYDHACRDFFTISSRSRVPFVAADKSHDTGEQIINDLFQNDMMFIYADKELAKLGGELATLRKDTPKTKAKDDFTDAFRYAISQIPWDFSAIHDAKLGRAYDDSPAPGEKPPTDLEIQIMERRGGMLSTADHNRLAAEQAANEEFEEINADYGC